MSIIRVVDIGEIVDQHCLKFLISNIFHLTSQSTVSQ